MQKVKLELHTSHQLFYLLASIHLAVILGLLFTSLALWLIVCIQLFCVASAYQLMRRYVFLNSAKSIICCTQQADDMWLLTNRCGETLATTLSTDSVIAYYLCILNFKSTVTKRRISVVILRDTVDSESLRQLRVLK